jgi:hypothetical protein
VDSKANMTTPSLITKVNEVKYEHILHCNANEIESSLYEENRGTSTKQSPNLLVIRPVSAYRTFIGLT